LLAIERGLPDGEVWEAESTVAFRSDRRWSGADFGVHGAWVLGAVQAIAPDDTEISARVRNHAETGGRVLVLGRSRSEHFTDNASSPPESEPAAIVVLADTIRPQVRQTLEYFSAQGVAIKVLSGDDVETVAAVCRQVGIEGECRDVSEPSDVRNIVEEATVFGRVAPDRKREMVEQLQHSGHVVAMVGDGVNDVPSMKQADIAVAMGSGADATRTVGQVVLADSDFDRFPDVVAEGRRVIFNIERVAKLYLTKTIYALLLAVAVGIAGVTFPLLPRHVTIVGSLTIGIPSFWLALEPGAARARPGFVGRVLTFAAPSGLLVAGAGFGAFWLANDTVTTIEAQTTTMLTLTGVGLLVMIAAVLPLSRLDRALVAAMVGCLALVSLVPALRDFYAVDLPRPLVFMAAVGIVALAGTVLWAAHHVIDDVVRPRFLGSDDGP
jgi:cation-transporting ATPase E